MTRPLGHPGFMKSPRDGRSTARARRTIPATSLYLRSFKDRSANSSPDIFRAYHYTRLLPHERALLLNAGLRPLSAELLFDRIEAARTEGALSAREAANFHKAHVFATSEERYRKDQVCLVLSKRVFERDPEACRSLLTIWGGEGMYMSSGAQSFKERLMSLGSPTVVVTLLELGGDGFHHHVFPALHKVFVAAVLGLPDVGANVFYRAPVPAENIECILPA
jgi:hypothetical protein